ncbi:hypothetical protein EDS67_02050 [candidate division KSB1 bacterium]|nr:MAG: hypothetical protein EDS67_02050 [candidate division KSB1 bacterium]MBC6946491.1 hypothetical protein [candidate division KSB1 bacterium]MCE7940513.1 hypothetical protein [Chlorobi bacterium CHB1]RIK68408.1 MAG: hypothetical protein DCC62_24355 [candidate division KSB1 bacterium]
MNFLGPFFDKLNTESLMWWQKSKNDTRRERRSLQNFLENVFLGFLLLRLLWIGKIFNPT